MSSGSEEDPDPASRYNSLGEQQAAVPVLVFDCDFVAAKLHDLWRGARRQEDGTILPRRKVVNGVDFDIANLEFGELPPKFQLENRQAGRTAYDSVREEAVRLRRNQGRVDFSNLEDEDFIERAADRQHQAWCERNLFWGQTGLMVPYLHLPEDEKEKDRVIVREVVRQLALAWNNQHDNFELMPLPASFTIRIERTLIVHLKEAKKLITKDGKTPNACVVAKAGGGNMYTSAVCWGSAAPVWHEEWCLNVEGTFQGLQIEVATASRKKDTLAPIGRVSLPKSSLVGQSVRDQWFTLCESTVYVSGAVNVKVFVTPAFENTPSMLQLMIVEAKDLLTKSKGTADPYVEITVGKQKQTTSKKKRTLSPVFNEKFDFELPLFGASDVKISVFHHKRLVTASFMGSASIPVSELRALEGSGWHDMWLDLAPIEEGKGAEDSAVVGQIKLRIAYYEFPVLPVEEYQGLIKLFHENHCPLLMRLGERSAEKEAMATTAMRLLYHTGGGPAVVELLEKIMTEEVEHTSSLATLFRGDSMATKAITSFMRKMVGGEYIRNTLRPVALKVMESKKITGEKVRDVTQHEEILPEFLELQRDLRKAIFDSAVVCPIEMRMLFRKLQEEVATKFEDEENAPYIAVSGLFFLRFIVPAIMSPGKYGVLDEAPDADRVKVFIELAKPLQRVANLTSTATRSSGHNAALFDGSDQFQEEGRLMLRAFIDTLTRNIPAMSADSSPVSVDYEVELALLHGHIRREMDLLSCPPEDSLGMALADVISHLNDREKELVSDT